MTKVSTPERKVSEQLSQIAGELEKKIDSAAGKHMGFSLIVFNTEIGSRMNYISNCDRKDVINAMQSLLLGWGEGMPDIPAHKID